MAGATTRVGNSEIQLVYEMQQAMQFKGDPTNNAEWVQWRNEMRLEYQYEDLVEDNKIFGQYTIPFIRKADFSLMYRGRVDPMYIVRDKYHELYNDNQTDHFLFPENDIREINLDTDFGEVFGHKLSMRLGKQQICGVNQTCFAPLILLTLSALTRTDSSAKRLKTSVLRFGR